MKRKLKSNNKKPVVLSEDNNHVMRRILLHISLLILAVSMLSCDKTPRGVLSVNDMADLIVDLQLANSYIESNYNDFTTDSSKQVLRQSIFKEHGITQQDYDSSLVWYAHNMEDYVKAYDKAVGKLKDKYEKLQKSNMGNNGPSDIIAEGNMPGEPTHNPIPRPAGGKKLKRLEKTGDTKADSIDMWKGKRSYWLTQGAQQGFITFDLLPDAGHKPGDRYQLAYKLMRGGNEFKVSLNVDYSDGSTSQMARGTNSDGWVVIDVQSDTSRTVRRVYGYVSYNIKPGHTAYVDSLMLMRTHLNKGNYGIIHAQRHFERSKP